MQSNEISIASHLLRTESPFVVTSISPLLSEEPTTPTTTTIRPEVPFFKLFNRQPYLHEGLHWTRPTRLNLAARNGATRNETKRFPSAAQDKHVISSTSVAYIPISELGEKVEKTSYWHPVNPSQVAVFSQEDAVTGPLAYKLLQASYDTLRDRSLDTEIRRIFVTNNSSSNS